MSESCTCGLSAAGWDSRNSTERQLHVGNGVTGRNGDAVRFIGAGFRGHCPREVRMYVEHCLGCARFLMGQTSTVPGSGVRVPGIYSGVSNYVLPAVSCRI